MSAERVIASMRRDFLLDLSDGFVYDCLDWRARRIDTADHRRWVLDRSGGTLCVDEPLKDLKAWGLSREVVVTDGSNLYPALLGELWPEARHQPGVFHVPKELHKHVLDALRRLRRRPSRRGQRGRKRRPGRPAKARARRRGLTNKEKSAFVFKHLWLIVGRREKMGDQERADLATMLSYLPELATLRDFVDRSGLLFEEGQGEASAWRRHAGLVSDDSFLAVPELAKAIGAFGSENFAKMIAFPKSPACHRVRTNNHVERVDRELRYEEKARSGWRSRRTTVRFLVLLLDRCWDQERAVRNRWQGESPPTVRGRSSPRREAV